MNCIFIQNVTLIVVKNIIIAIGIMQYYIMSKVKYLKILYIKNKKLCEASNKTQRSGKCVLSLMFKPL